MTKSQILILLIFIAFMVYYWESKQKPVIKPSLPKKPILPSSIKPFSLPTNNNPDEIIEKKPSPIMPFETNTLEKELNLPDDFVLAPDNPDDYYRQQVLGFLEDWLASFNNPQQQSKITQVISLLQANNKKRGEYLQALWSLKGLAGFDFYVGQSFQEWVNLPVKVKPTEAPADYGWLTDDNLEFILKNCLSIQAALTKQNQASKVFHLRTDIANVYNAFYKAKSKQDWPLVEFLQELEWNKAQYMLLPLRVNGNHWGLVVLEDKDGMYEVYYTSAGGEDLESEKEQLKPFIEQICGENTSIKIIQPADRESKGYECGVYLVFYLLELLETGKLELKHQYTEQECQNFRWEWKERIGEKWCCWN